MKLGMTLFSSSSIKKGYLLLINATCLQFNNRKYSIHNFGLLWSMIKKKKKKIRVYSDFAS